MPSPDNVAFSESELEFDRKDFVSELVSVTTISGVCGSTFGALFDSLSKDESI